MESLERAGDTYGEGPFRLMLIKLLEGVVYGIHFASNFV